MSIVLLIQRFKTPGSVTELVEVTALKLRLVGLVVSTGSTTNFDRLNW